MTRPIFPKDMMNVLFTNIKDPPAMSGIALTQRLREEEPPLYYWHKRPCVVIISPTFKHGHKRNCGIKLLDTGETFVPHNKPIFPDMKLYEEILLLKGYFNGKLLSLKAQKTIF